MKNGLVAGLMLVAVSGIAFGADNERCAECNIAVRSAKYVVVKTSGTKVYGCPKCAFAAEDVDKAVSIEALDFLSGKPIDGRKAFYLIDTEVGACCAPYWLAFSSRDRAEKFAQGFGGEVMTYDEAKKYFSEDGPPGHDPEHQRYEHRYHDQTHEHDRDR